LSDVDALLGALDRLIAKKRDLKQAAMQQLLTGQTRLPGFHGEWEVRRLGEGLPNVQKSALLDFDVNYPVDPNEQRAIAAALGEMYSELEKLEQRHDKTRALKQAMMQELLTGKTRLV
jgi:restriction endonuclease S subunit